MQKTILSALLALSAFTANAKGIEAVGATEAILPSFYYSGEMWTAQSCIVNLGNVCGWGQSAEVQGVPENDANGHQWYEYDYTLTDGEYSWEATHAPYSSDDYYNNKPATVWTRNNIAADIYIRRTFTIDGKLPKTLYLMTGRDDGPSQYYINGTLVYSTDADWPYDEFQEMTPEMRALLKTDGSENVIACHVHNNFGGAYADCGIYAVPDGALQIGNLPMGYNFPWTARLLFNSEGGYNYRSNNNENPIHGWEKLYEAQGNETFTISMPTPSRDGVNARVQFKTPITVNPEHRYRFRATIATNVDLDGSEVYLSENEDDGKVLFHAEFGPQAQRNQKIEKTNINGIEINDLKFDFRFTTDDEDAIITINGLSLFDETDNRELWAGTSYYNYRYYRDPETGDRLKDMEIDGRVETLTWTNTGFDDSQWQEAVMPIGNWGYNPTPNTIWPGGDNTNFWIRRNFWIDEVKSTSKYVLSVCHDDCYTIYVNGHEVGHDIGWTDNANPVKIEIPYSYLNEGDNVIATYIQQNWGGKFYDCGLIVTEDFYEEADDDADLRTLEINEVCIANIDQTLDHSLNYGAWLEVYNRSDKRVALEGLYVSDDAADLKKFQIPANSGVVPAHGFRAIFFDHNAAEGNFGANAFKQVAFKPETEGGTLYISDKEGNLISEITYPEAIARCSFARKSLDSNEWGYNSKPTPNTANSSSTFASLRLEAPVVDTDSRIIDSPISFTVAIPKGATLRYTTDGSTPTADNGETSTDGRFDVNWNSIYRFCLIKDGMLPSQVVTRSFLFRDRDFDLPFISVVTDRENLYNDEYGVYTVGTNGVPGHGINYASNKNMDWERPVNFEYFTADGECVLNQEATFYISGGYSRHWGPASFKIKAEKQYEGLNYLPYPLFKEKPFNKNKMVVFRNGGNDNSNRAKDAVLQRIVQRSGIYIDGQEYQPVHVFLNGEYLTMLNMREPSNKHFAYANYGWDTDEQDAFELPMHPDIVTKAGDMEALNRLFELAETADNPESYEEICRLLEVDEYINYMASQCFMGLEDWLTSSNNLKCFRSRNDGRFHFMQFDLDSAFDHNFTNILIRLRDGHHNLFIKLFNDLMQNEELQRKFIDAYCIISGSVFTTERAEEAANYVGHMAERALGLEWKSPWGTCNWLVNEVNDKNRREQGFNYLDQYFSLEESMTSQISANIPEAQISLNGQMIPAAQLSGRLYAPFTLKATAPAGYDFVGWESGKTETFTPIHFGDLWRYYDQGSLGTDKKWRRASTDSWSEGYAPLGYNKNGLNTEVEYGGDANNKYPTTYFRHDFTLDEKLPEGTLVTLDYVVDDGFVIYVNGQEAFRYLMPDGEPTFETYASHLADSNPDHGTAIIKASLFQQGTNRIAVEVHNENARSTDIYWDAALTISSNVDPQLLSTEREIEILNNSDQNFHAVFEPIDEKYFIAAGQTPVVINEVSAGNSIYVNDYYKKNDWIELYNTTSEPIDVAGMYLSDNPDKPTKYKIEASTVEGSTIIPAHGYLVVWADKLDPLFQLHASFKLANGDGESITLTAADLSWSDRLEYVEHTGEETVGRYPDGGKQIYKMVRPTIAAQNQLTYFAEWLSGKDENFDLQAYLDSLDIISPETPLTSEMEFYTVDGMRLNTPQRGINIVRMTDGTTRKVIIR